jgi:hypothetical protein
MSDEFIEPDFLKTMASEPCHGQREDRLLKSFYTTNPPGGNREFSLPG